MASIFDYNNPTQGLLCNEKIESFNSIARDINSKCNCGMSLFNEAKGIVSDCIGDYVYSDRKFPNVSDAIDLDKIQLNGFGIGGVAECLADNMPFVDTAKGALGDLLKNAKSIYTSAIEYVMSMIKKATNFVSAMVEVTAEKLNFIMQKIESTFASVLEPVTNTIFGALDKVSDFVSGTGILTDIQKIQNMTECLTSNCGRSSPLIDFNGALDKMPIDRYTGEFRPYKLLGSESGGSIVNLLDKDYRNTTANKAKQFNDMATKLVESMGF